LIYAGFNVTFAQILGKKVTFKVHFKNKDFSVGSQHIRYGLTPFFFGILLPSVATSYMLDMLSEIFAMVDKWN